MNRLPTGAPREVYHPPGICTALSGTGDLTIGAAKDPVVSRREPPARPSHQNCIPPPRAAATDAATGWA